VGIQEYGQYLIVTLTDRLIQFYNTFPVSAVIVISLTKYKLSASISFYSTNTYMQIHALSETRETANSKTVMQLKHDGIQQLLENKA